MFFNRAVKRVLRQDVYSRPLLPAVLVFFTLMVMIAVSYKTARNDIITHRNNSVNQNASFVENTLRQRFSIYEDTLRAANGLFLSSDSVSRDEWTVFVKSLMLTERYPGIRGVGYVKLVTSQDKEAYIASVQSDNVPNFTIYPIGERPEYASLTYIVPTAGQQFDARTTPALGFDMYTDPKRKDAMIKAASSGKPTLSGLVNLIQESSPKPNGFLLYLPLYKRNSPVATPEERLAALEGYFYAPFLTSNVFETFFDINEPSFAFTIHAGQEVIEKNLIYESNPEVSTYLYNEVRRKTINFYNQDWTFVYKASKNIVPYSVRSRPLSVAIGGSIFSAALASIIYLLIQRRTRALTYNEQKKLEAAKDELLSLASHQLRTPATAVKQYVSMVKEGFAGSINDDQKKLLSMAYESNERQLTIVDDLLYVARIDAGQAALRPEQVDIKELLQSVINDQLTVIKGRRQKVQFNSPKRAVIAEADPQYLRMIFENLLSNASKYSHRKTKIEVSLHTHKGQVVISFADKGVGIASEDFKNVFVKFSRIPNELSRNIAGSGIGLYLAKQLAMLHQGDIKFTSAPHKGSVFVVTIPKEQQSGNVR